MKHEELIILDSGFCNSGPCPKCADPCHAHRSNAAAFSRITSARRAPGRSDCTTRSRAIISMTLTSLPLAAARCSAMASRLGTLLCLQHRRRLCSRPAHTAKGASSALSLPWQRAAQVLRPLPATGAAAQPTAGAGALEAGICPPRRADGAEKHKLGAAHRPKVGLARHVSSMVSMRKLTLQGSMIMLDPMVSMSMLDPMVGS